MSKSLVIVESPAKARTLTKYLGKGYVVKASVGHVIDLPQKRIGVDIEAGFEPEWVVSPGKKRIIEDLKKAAAGADLVYLASDPDREGEAIAWHIAGAIDASKTIHRVLINEITKRGVADAMEHPIKLNESLFNAQQARRILDRLVGYKLSPLLQSKVRKGLSAGRVQSVAVRLVCEREAAIEAFVPEEYWSIEVILRADEPPTFIARLVEIEGEKARIGDGEAAQKIVDNLTNGEYHVRDIKRKDRYRNPPPPFTTAKLQQEASRKLKLTARQTMSLAQRLYEGLEIGEHGPVGLITYMRTDSVRVSADAQNAARDVISARFGPEHLPQKPPIYKSRKEAQEAHEAIRPTDLAITPEDVAKHVDRELARLYELIYLRFLASQMKPAVLDQLQINIINGAYLLRTTATTVKFPGFTAAYTEGKDEETVENGAENGEGKVFDLPPLKEGQRLTGEKITPEQHFTQPPPRFTEATLVKELEERGIGRPSTYAQILGTIQERDYVGKQEGKFFPTDLGRLVNELLVGSFPDILNVEFTARMEEDLDRIEEGGLNWREALSSFWKPFSASLEQARKAMRNVKKEREEITDIPCGVCGKPMVVRWGRKGEFIACSAFPKCKNTSNFRRDESGAIQLLPNGAPTPCPVCGKPLVVRSGKKGEFLGCSSYPECSYTTDFTRDEQGVPHPVKAPDPGATPGQNTEEAPPACPACGKPMIKKQGRWGPYFACAGFPECKQTIRIKTAKVAPQPTDIPCDKCGKPMVIRMGRRGEFLACSGYPTCKNAKNFTRDADGKITVTVEESTDEKCEKCGKPMAVRKGRWGPFLACTGYPDCNNIRKIQKK